MNTRDTPVAGQPGKREVTIKTNPVTTPKRSSDNNKHGSTLPTATIQHDSIPPPEMCVVKCDTKNIAGVEISFFDSQQKKNYVQVSDGGVMAFHVPCYLLKKQVTVRFSNNHHIEERTFEGDEFVLPELFTRTHP